MTSLPNDLFERGRRVLARFGYRPPGAQAEDWAAAWEPLRGDFPGGAPSYGDLDAAARAAARDYMARRRAADRRLEACEALHAALFADGIATDAVERYAAAREAYEDAVEEFGRARERLAALLGK